MKRKQGREDAVGRDFEYGAKGKVRGAESSRAIEIPIVALDKAAQGRGSVGVTEREYRCQHATGSDLEDSAKVFGAAVRRGPVTVSVVTKRQAVLWIRAVIACERHECR